MSGAFYESEWAEKLVGLAGGGGSGEEVGKVIEEMGEGGVGFEIDTPITEYEDTLLSEAAAKGNVGVVEEVLGRGASVASVSTFGATPLHRACFHGQEEVIRILVAAGASLTARTSHDNSTPLMKLKEGVDDEIRRLLTPASASTTTVSGDDDS